jgi:hypothetical protein
MVQTRFSFHILSSLLGFFSYSLFVSGLFILTFALSACASVDIASIIDESSQDLPENIDVPLDSVFEYNQSSQIVIDTVASIPHLDTYYLRSDIVYNRIYDIVLEDPTTNDVILNAKFLVSPVYDEFGIFHESKLELLVDYADGREDTVVLGLDDTYMFTSQLGIKVVDVYDVAVTMEFYSQDQLQDTLVLMQFVDPAFMYSDSYANLVSSPLSNLDVVGDVESWFFTFAPMTYGAQSLHNITQMVQMYVPGIHSSLNLSQNAPILEPVQNITENISDVTHLTQNVSVILNSTVYNASLPLDLPPVVVLPIDQNISIPLNLSFNENQTLPIDTCIFDATNISQSLLCFEENSTIVVIALNESMSLNISDDSLISNLQNQTYGLIPNNTIQLNQSIGDLPVSNSTIVVIANQSLDDYQQCLSSQIVQNTTLMILCALNSSETIIVPPQNVSSQTVFVEESIQGGMVAPAYILRRNRGTYNASQVTIQPSLSTTQSQTSFTQQSNLPTYINPNLQQNTQPQSQLNDGFSVGYVEPEYVSQYDFAPIHFQIEPSVEVPKSVFDTKTFGMPWYLVALPLFFILALVIAYLVIMHRHKKIEAKRLLEEERLRAAQLQVQQQAQQARMQYQRPRY